MKEPDPNLDTYKKPTTPSSIDGYMSLEGNETALMDDAGLKTYVGSGYVHSGALPREAPFSDLHVSQDFNSAENSNIVLKDPIMSSNQVVVFIHNASTHTPITWDSSADCQVVSYSFHVMVGIIVCFVAIFAIVGNSLVLYTYARHSSLRTSSNLLIINLTVADLIMSTIDLPLFVISSFKGCWILGYIGCQFYGLSSALTALVTINTLAAISFDRYIVVVHRLSPMHRMNKSTTGIIIVIIWLMSLIWSVIPLTNISSYRLEGVGTSCTFNYVDRRPSQRWFFIGLVIFNFFIPLILICFSYWRIFVSVKRVKRELKLLQGGYSSALRQRIETQAEVKTAITAFVIISIFCAAWSPYVIIAFVGLFGKEGSISPLVSVFPNILAKISTVSNPILYSIGHPEVRKRMKKLMLSTYQDSFWRPTSATVGNSSPPLSDNLNDMSMPTYL